MLIFDEAHHCQKKHPYNAIMDTHYRSCPDATKPRIFGMTASPIWNSKNPERSLRELEQNMDARVVGVKENVAELEMHSPKPKEVIIFSISHTSSEQRVACNSISTTTSVRLSCIPKPYSLGTLEESYTIGHTSFPTYGSV